MWTAVFTEEFSVLKVLQRFRPFVVEFYLSSTIFLLSYIANKLDGPDLVEGCGYYEDKVV